MRFSVSGLRELDSNLTPEQMYYKEANGTWELVGFVLEAFICGASKVVITKKEGT